MITTATSEGETGEHFIPGYILVGFFHSLSELVKKLVKAVFLLSSFEETRPLHEGNDRRRILYSFLEKNLKY
jgi:hypothetical protein